MNRTRLLIFCLCLTLSSLALGTSADAPPAQPVERVETDAKATPDLAVNRAEQDALAGGATPIGQGTLYQRDESTKTGDDGSRLSPMMIEIKAVLANQRAEQRSLEEAFADAIDNSSALAIQKQIEELAQQTEIDIMNIQVESLRAAGRVSEAQAIEDELERMASPRPILQPVDRAAGESPRTRR